MLCCELSIVKRDVNEPTGTVLRCNLWTCDYCLPFKQRRLKSLARAGEPTLFITLTASPQTDENDDKAAQKLVRAWRLTVKRAKRHFGYRKLPYLTVIEATKAGRPHLHILARCPWIGQQWLSKTLNELAEAPIVDVRSVRGLGKISAYVAKYIGKEPHHFAGCKRFWRSLDWIADRQKWQDENEHEPGAWKLCRYSLAELATQLVRLGYAVTWTRPNYITGEPAWQENSGLAGRAGAWLC
jgi:hypothetical protein